MKKTSIALLALLSLGNVSAKGAWIELGDVEKTAELKNAPAPVEVPKDWIFQFKNYEFFVNHCAVKFGGVSVNTIDSVVVKFNYAGANRMPKTMSLIVKDTPSLVKAQGTLQEYSTPEYTLAIQTKSQKSSIK